MASHWQPVRFVREESPGQVCFGVWVGDARVPIRVLVEHSGYQVERATPDSWTRICSIPIAAERARFDLEWQIRTALAEVSH